MALFGYRLKVFQHTVVEFADRRQKTLRFRLFAFSVKTQFVHSLFSLPFDSQKATLKYGAALDYSSILSYFLSFFGFTFL